MTTLGELAANARSKNAGPFAITIDFFFDSVEDFAHVVESGAVSVAAVADRLGLDPASVTVHNFEPACAIKVSYPRASVANGPGERDSYGGQQFAALLDLDIADRVQTFPRGRTQKGVALT